MITAISRIDWSSSDISIYECLPCYISTDIQVSPDGSPFSQVRKRSPNTGMACSNSIHQEAGKETSAPSIVKVLIVPAGLSAVKT